MKNSIVILISSAGRRVELADCFRRDAAAMGLKARILAADSDPDMSPACQLAERAVKVPRADSPSFIEQLLDLCQVHRVNLLVPTIDTELLVLAENRARFEAAGTHLAISSPEVVRLARDKIATSRLLQQAGIPTPRTASLGEVRRAADGWKWPLILKPINGSSSKGLFVAANARDIDNFSAPEANYLAQEMWTGREYTVNMYFDHASRLRCAVPHWRQEIRSGEVSKAVTVRHPLLVDLAQRLALTLPGARGPLCFQAIATPDNAAAIFEINARFGGGYPLAHAAGARFSKWLIEEALGRRSSARNMWRANLSMLRYDRSVFR